MVYFRKWAVAAVAAIGLLSFPAAAWASDNGQASIQPKADPGQSRLFFFLDLTAGETATDVLTLVNKTNQPLTFDLYASDAFDDDHGAFVLRRAEDAKVGVGRWIALPEQAVSVPASGSTDLPFQVAVPKDATPGDHAGGIVALARPSDVQSPPADVNVRVRKGVGVRIYTRVAGPVHPGLEVSGLGLERDSSLASWVGLPRPGALVYRVTNSGNVRLTPVVNLEVHGPLGWGRARRARQLPELLPGQSATLREPVPEVWAVGPERARVTATAGSVSATRTLRVWVTPWLLLAAGACLAVGVALRRLSKRTPPVPSLPST